MRRAGAAALDLCYVGAGRLDGFWEHEDAWRDFEEVEAVREELREILHAGPGEAARREVAVGAGGPDTGAPTSTVQRMAPVAASRATTVPAPVPT